MRALTYEGPYRVAVRNKPDPRIEHPQDGIVRVTAAAICGSDLHLLHGLVPDTRVGSTFGHEIVGVVEELGPEATGLSVGDRVMLPFPIFCGACFYCQRGMTSSCESTNPATDAATGVYGYGHLTGGYDGGQAELVRAPFIAVDAEKIPEDMDDLTALPLTDALSTGYFGAEMCNLKGGETVVVYGAGPVGLFAMRSLWLMGAGRVIAVDEVDYRLDFARRWAGVETLNFRDVDIITTIKGLTDDRGADASVDAVGCEAAGSGGQRLAGVYGKLQGGSISVVGVYGPPYAAFDFGTAMNKQQTIRTGQCPVKRYMPHLIEHIRAGRIDPKPLFTHRVPLEKAPDAYHTFARKQDGCIKVALFPDGTTIH
jgi:threonine dehydrogenase-like Zn-dependent dehydrogenase